MLEDRGKRYGLAFFFFFWSDESNVLIIRRPQIVFSITPLLPEAKSLYHHASNKMELFLLLKHI